MDPLGNPELAHMRETLAQTLPGTAVVQTRSYVSDGGGGGTTVWSPAGTFSARLAPYTHGSGEQVEGDRLAADSEYIFTFPAETAIDHNAQVVYNGGTFAVTAVRKRTRELSRRVEVKEVNG